MYAAACAAVPACRPPGQLMSLSARADMAAPWKQMGMQMSVAGRDGLPNAALLYHWAAHQRPRSAESQAAALHALLADQVELSGATLQPDSTTMVHMLQANNPTSMDAGWPQRSQRRRRRR